MSSTDWAIAGSTIATVGILANSLSISYFIQKEKSTLPAKQFLLLNSLDLIMCAASSVTLILAAILKIDLGDIYDGPRPAIYFAILFIGLSQMMLEGTAFATCILSVCRCVKLWFPFYQINGKFLGVFTAAFYLYLGMRESAGLYYTYLFVQDNTQRGGLKSLNKVVDYSVLVSVSGILLVVTISNVLCVWTLVSGEVASRNEGGPVRSNKDATVNIIIVSTLFLFFNMANMVPAWTGAESDGLFFKLGERLALPINSALNPVVYFLRRKAMRQHVKNFFCMKSEVEPLNSVQRQTEASQNSVS